MSLSTLMRSPQRVKTRVKEGGHNIPTDTIERRYANGLCNFFKIYKPLVSRWILVDNSTESFEFIAEGSGTDVIIRSEKKWSQLREEYNGN